jgi:hypothetical protein
VALASLSPTKINAKADTIAAGGKPDGSGIVELSRAGYPYPEAAVNVAPDTSLFSVVKSINLLRISRDRGGTGSRSP